MADGAKNEQNAGAGPGASGNGPRCIVGLGASAGGLKSLEDFFGNIPSDTGCAFVVVQHLSPDFKSLMQELLSRHTSMAVHRVHDGMPLESNAVYLIPPNYNMIVRDGALHLTEREPRSDHRPNFPIDIFLESLALDAAARAVAIILSGTGSDGSRGILEIHERGGFVLVEDPDAAEFDGMPLAAINTNLADRVLSAAELADAVCDIATQAEVGGEDGTNQIVKIDDRALADIIGVLSLDGRSDFSQYRPGTLIRRIERRRVMAKRDDADSYIELLKQSPEERQLLRSDMLINVTGFFRDADAWHELRTSVLPRLVTGASQDAPLRIWITACSTGEEAYSMAIVVCETLERLGRHIDVKIFATDLDADSLSDAAAGHFPESIAKDLTAEQLDRYFTHKDNRYHVTRKIRNMIVFACHDLTRDAPFTKMALVTCRNLLIYFKPSLQAQVLRNLHFALVHRGVLWLGASETLAALEDEFIAIDRRWRLWEKKRDVRLAGPHLPTAAGLSPAQARSGPHEPNKVQRRQADMLAADAFAAQMTRVGATCLIVSTTRELVHMVADPLHVMRVPTGRATQEVTKLVLEPIALPLNTAIQRAISRKETVTYQGIRIEQPGSEGGHLAVDVHVSFHWAGRITPDYLLVCIEPSARRGSSAPMADFDPDSVAAARIADLERELQETKESLQSTIEELETTNEEHQATNEEVVSSNEELQSTNEELHSVNEELYTVNAEYQQKISELSQLNADMDSLLASTEIGTVFLDGELSIRKFTPSAAQAIHLVEADIGRPLRHIAHKLDTPNSMTTFDARSNRACPANAKRLTATAIASSFACTRTATSRSRTRVSC